MNLSFLRLGFFFFLFWTCILHSYELAVVSMFHNTAPWIKEWVIYHHMTGVEHFWLYNHSSTDNWEEELKPYIEEGIVEVFDWPASRGDWVPDQIRAFCDGIYRAIGVATWVALIDQDEFILPIQGRSIVGCLKKHFSDQNAIYVNWRNFGTNHVNLSEGESMLSRLVSCSEKLHPRNCVGKTIVRPEAADPTKMWSPHFCPLKEGFEYVNGEGGKTLVLDGTDLKTDGKNHEGFIRINHYALRDEKYFHNYRLPRDSNPGLMHEHYEAFNLHKDYQILKFIRKNYPQMYEKYWKRKGASKAFLY